MLAIADIAAENTRAALPARPESAGGYRLRFGFRLERRGVPGFFAAYGKKTEPGRLAGRESRIRTLTMAAEFALLLRDRFAATLLERKPN
jgi:hypothetical protein